jgi:hypothetical protein
MTVSSCIPPLVHLPVFLSIFLFICLSLCHPVVCCLACLHVCVPVFILSSLSACFHLSVVTVLQSLLPVLSVAILPTCVCLPSCLPSLCLADMSILASRGWRVEPIPKTPKKLSLFYLFFIRTCFPYLESFLESIPSRIPTRVCVEYCTN